MDYRIHHLVYQKMGSGHMTEEKARKYAQSVFDRQVKDCPNEELKTQLIHILTIAFLEGYTEGLMYYLNGVAEQSIH